MLLSGYSMQETWPASSNHKGGFPRQAGVCHCKAACHKDGFPRQTDGVPPATSNHKGGFPRQEGLEPKSLQEPQLQSGPR